jgi:stress response protein YsnF
VIDGPLILLPGKDWTTVSFNSHTVRVEKDRALLDEVEVAKIPADATEVAVTVKDGGLTISANGTTVASQQIK